MKLRTLALLVFVLALPAIARAQTPIIIGPTSAFAWDVDMPTVTEARALTFLLSTDAAVPVTLTGVTCVTASTGVQTCSVLASTLPLGAHSLTVAASSAGLTSLPSTSFAYLTMVIPIPRNLRFK